MKKLLLIALILSFPIIAQAGIPPEVIKTAENKGNLKKLLTKQCGLNYWRQVDDILQPPTGCSLTFSQLYAHDQNFRSKVSKAFKESPFDGRELMLELSSTLEPPYGDADEGWWVITDTRGRSLLTVIFSVPEYNQIVTFIANDLFLENVSSCRYGFYGDTQNTAALEYALDYMKGNYNNLKGCKQLTKVDIGSIF